MTTPNIQRMTKPENLHALAQSTREHLALIEAIQERYQNIDKPPMFNLPVIKTQLLERLEDIEARLSYLTHRKEGLVS